MQTTTMMRRTLSAAALLMTLAACSGETDDGAVKPQETAKAEEQKPVTLTVFFKSSATYSDEDFNRFYVEPTNKKFPHVTLKKIERDGSSGMEHLNRLLLTNSMPDIISDGVTNLAEVIAIDVPADLTELIKKHNFDMNKLNSSAVQFVKSFGQNGEFYNIPLSMNSFATYYNKNIFDLLGVPYPKDSMTWEEYTSLAKRLTTTRDGISYHGLQMGIFNRIPSQLSLAYVDPKTNTALIQNEGWRKMFQTFKEIHDIPGNLTPKTGDLLQGRNRFVKDMNIAIMPDIQLSEEMLSEFVTKGGEWDIASFPTFRENPQVGTGVYASGLFLPKGGKNMDIAFQVIANLLSEEVQREAAKNGNFSVLSNPNVHKDYMANSSIHRGKNLAAYYYNKVAPPYPISQFDAIATKHYTEGLRKYVYGQAGYEDLNTTMRTIEELVNTEIKAEIVKTGK